MPGFATYSLTHAVEGEVEFVDHVTGVLGGTVHGNHTGTLLGDVVLLDQGEDQGGHVEFLEKIYFGRIRTLLTA